MILMKRLMIKIRAYRTRYFTSEPLMRDPDESGITFEL